MMLLKDGPMEGRKKSAPLVERVIRQIVKKMQILPKDWEETSMVQELQELAVFFVKASADEVKIKGGLSKMQ